MGNPIDIRPLLLLIPLLLALPSSGHVALSRISIPSLLDDFVAGAWTDFKSLLDARAGDTREALVALKRYLAQFGYLNLTAGANVTALFDNDTLAAVKLYQESFNLTATGVLDLQTLLKMITPRCGREDVVGGIPLMLQSTSTAGGEGRGLGVGRYAFFPGRPTWPQGRRALTYAFSAVNETARVGAEARQAAFRAAFSEWGAVVPINFTEAEDYGMADVKIEFVSYGHGDGEPFDGVLGILAHAFSPPDGRFHLDDSEFWSAGHVDTGPAHHVDLQSVVTHEIGHLLGLAHSPVPDAIMYPSIAPGQIKLQLQPDDIQGAQALYGVNPTYDPNAPLPGVPSALADVNNLAPQPSPPSLLLVWLLLVFPLLLL